jgi:hypothetical protein
MGAKTLLHLGTPQPGRLDAMVLVSVLATGDPVDKELRLTERDKVFVEMMRHPIAAT